MRDYSQKNSQLGPVHTLECSCAFGSDFSFPPTANPFLLEDILDNPNEPNYYMGNVDTSPFTDNFYIKVLQQSFITIGNLSGSVVGEPFLITENGGGLIQVLNSNCTRAWDNQSST